MKRKIVKMAKEMVSVLELDDIGELTKSDIDFIAEHYIKQAVEYLEKNTTPLAMTTTGSFPIASNLCQLKVDK